jgi:hypothetical protein
MMAAWFVTGVVVCWLFDTRIGVAILLVSLYWACA